MPPLEPAEPRLDVWEYSCSGEFEATLGFTGFGEFYSDTSKLYRKGKHRKELVAENVSIPYSQVPKKLT